MPMHGLYLSATLTFCIIKPDNKKQAILRGQHGCVRSAQLFLLKTGDSYKTGRTCNTDISNVIR